MCKTITDQLIVKTTDIADLVRSPWYSRIFSLRLEELIALLFFGPMVYFTSKAYLFFQSQGQVPKVLIGDIQRSLESLKLF
jgi:hypothetical protein